MKKALLSSVCVVALATAHAGGDHYSYKDSKETLQQTMATQWYGDNEWNLGLWGTYAFTQNGGEETPTLGTSREWRSDRYLGADDAWGGGLDLKYFCHRYFGIGLEGYGLAVHRDAPPATKVVIGSSGRSFLPQSEDKTVGAVLGTFTLRYPIGRFAPYLFFGGGVIFGGGEVQHFELTGLRGGGTNYAEAYRGGESTAALGQFGGGIEMRITRHIGLTSDFSWNAIDGPNNNFGMVRAGVNFAF